MGIRSARDSNRRFGPHSRRDDGCLLAVMFGPRVCSRLKWNLLRATRTECEVPCRGKWNPLRVPDTALYRGER